MSSTLYVQRHLLGNGKEFTESELLAKSNYAVILAEPGGGKTTLMESLANQLGARVITATRFAYTQTEHVNMPLLIDAFDELSKAEGYSIGQLLYEAKKSNPTHLYLSSRSSEWDDSATYRFEEILGHRPLVVRLRSLSKEEQRSILSNYSTDLDFDAFRAEVARFELEALLSNPQFLQLLADAYIQSGNCFVDKHSIFSKAVERLAKETSHCVPRRSQSLSLTQKINIASEVFTKLLLSASEGISTREATDSRLYPHLASLIKSSADVDSILETRLFIPGVSADQHIPVHKIISEYCAANYLVKRISDSSDFLSLSKCLAIIAPNSTVRDELRGLLGWMAALGSKEIEESAIKIDPYSVLANGDPSQIEHSSKHLLLDRLIVLEGRDPYFRRGDFCRSFSIAGFITEDMMEKVSHILASRSDGHLRDLILELLACSPAQQCLKEQIHNLVLSPAEHSNSRILAVRCLLNYPDYNYAPDFDQLVVEASSSSLKVVVEVFGLLGLDRFDIAETAQFLRACASLYTGSNNCNESLIGERYFVKRFISVLDLTRTTKLLDEVTKGISCVCRKSAYECDCRTGISKIAGLLLDRYFEVAAPPFSSHSVWQWVSKLNFRQPKHGDQSNAVRALQTDDALRQGILAHVFSRLKDNDQIHRARHDILGYNSHSGLGLLAVDHMFLVNLAYDNNNTQLWASFIPMHPYYLNKVDRGPHELRRHMREQALKRPLLMREWAKANREASQRFEAESRIMRGRRNRRYSRRRRKQEDIRKANIKYVQDNRDFIEAGRHLDCLYRFAELVLVEPEQIAHIVGDEVLVRNALRNSLNTISPYVQTLGELAKLRCCSKSSRALWIVYAACLELMRATGTLDGVSTFLLQALRTNINMHYPAVSTSDRSAVKEEIDRIAFPDIESVEAFLRQYLEPQLADYTCIEPDIHILCDMKIPSKLRADLSVEWIRSLHDIGSRSLERLFDIAVQYAERECLIEIIADRCRGFLSDSPLQAVSGDAMQLRNFWLLRAVYFLDDTPQACWEWLREDRSTIFLIEERSSRIGQKDNPHWPNLTPVKIREVLNAFIEQWPKVELKTCWGSDSPSEERAYRFLSDMIWLLSSCNPSDAIPILTILLQDSRFVNFYNSLKTIYVDHLRKKALRDFEPPLPRETVEFLNCNIVITVECMRKLLIEELDRLQKDIEGGEYNTVNRFYENGNHRNEVECAEIIAERLYLRLGRQGFSVTPEHHLKGNNRCDITLRHVIGDKSRLLVIEVKGQWHRELFIAASSQLHERYSIHPDAGGQGIYLVIWVGSQVKVGGRTNHDYASAEQLRLDIVDALPAQLAGLIDVYVLDVSRPD